MDKIAKKQLEMKEQKRNILDAYRNLVETGATSSDLPPISDDPFSKLNTWKAEYHPNTISSEKKITSIRVLNDATGVFRTYEKISKERKEPDRESSYEALAMATEQLSRYIQGHVTNEGTVDYSFRLLQDTYTELKEAKELTANQDMALSFLDRLKPIGIVPMTQAELVIQGAMKSMQGYHQDRRDTDHYYQQGDTNSTFIVNREEIASEIENNAQKSNKIANYSLNDLRSLRDNLAPAKKRFQKESEKRAWKSVKNGVNLLLLYRGYYENSSSTKTKVMNDLGLSGDVTEEQATNGYDMINDNIYLLEKDSYINMNRRNMGFREK